MERKPSDAVETKLLEPAAFRVSKVARLLDMSRSNVYELLNRGDLRGVKIRDSWRVPISEIERILSIRKS